ncbi:hypothetical protein HQ393_00560 [Chitinibacter bivalviorum]|uniref:Uncharacterized protein n=1 Tax=Chitinibacter bivalviorum TaxID=2739434 RepID=A0A7H9BDR7_9NEIS|nr:hypothetical protein [Chitinibacter bivalviorum]QLG86853.1 hypothetical protein HQ393_00560 [Chitinibacter bivalviorum]
MKYWLVASLIFPAVAMANEPAHTTETKPIKAAPAPEAHAEAKPTAPVMKNAPPTQVDNLKPHKEGAKPKAEVAAVEAKPTEPPVVQYVPPKYGTSRPVVISKAPRAQAAIHGRTTTSKVVRTENMAVTPGLVRTMPASSLPAGKVLPPAKGLSGNTVAANTAESKPRLTWGETTIVKPAAAPAPEIYIVRDPELRWQQYSYP